ncbi:replicative helicase loader/inhibitor [Intestinibacillus sp. Marseille-P6563]|uniref:replicative helicase loader/inhibitor n=1 Tax=Intestinibacillus sp. Marseille-P6563 TaxID=2364792 RepID=UPI0013E032B9|nr:replicative helicase loader/inhibitor [Intestinibacillus sp. Marseille-P6563]
MNRADTMRIMAIIKQVYPRYYANQTRDDLQVAVNLWTDMFKDDEGTLVLAAVKAFVATDTKGFPPSIGQIKQRLVRLKAPDMPDEAEAWRQVWDAVRNSAYHAKEEFEKLHPVVQRVVGRPEMLKSWAMLTPDEVLTVVASNFQRAYRVRAADVVERMALPAEIQELLKATDVTVSLPEPKDPEEQKRKAIALLQAERDEYAREVLGDG